MPLYRFGIPTQLPWHKPFSYPKPSVRPIMFACARTLYVAISLGIKRQCFSSIMYLKALAIAWMLLTCKVISGIESILWNENTDKLDHVLTAVCTCVILYHWWLTWIPVKYYFSISFTFRHKFSSNKFKEYCLIYNNLYNNNNLVFIIALFLKIKALYQDNSIFHAECSVLGTE